MNDNENAEISLTQGTSQNSPSYSPGSEVFSNSSNDYRPKSTIPFRDIKKFSGTANTETIQDFLFRFEHTSRLNNYSEVDQMNIIPMLLEGPALSVYRNLSVSQLSSPSSILNALVQRFDPTALRQGKKTKVYSTHMTDDEDLETFIENLLENAKNCQLSENETMGIFMTNVAPKIKKVLIMNQPTSLSAALSLARLKAVAIDSCQNKTKSKDSKSEDITEIKERLDSLIKSKNDDSNPNKVHALQSYSSGSEDAIKKLEHDMNEKFTNLLEEFRAYKNNNNNMNYSRRRNYPNQGINGPNQYQGNSNKNNSFRNHAINNKFPPNHRNAQAINHRNPTTRDIRTRESQIVCSFCGKAGHHAFACFARNRANNIQRYPVQRTFNPNDRFQKPNNGGNTPNSHEGWASFSNESSNTPRFNKINTISVMNTKDNLLLAIEILSPIVIKDANALCDSGAAISVINSKKFPQLRKFLNNKNKGDSIISVTGQEETIEGTLNIELWNPNSEGTTYEHEFHYANVGNESIILGRDFL